MGQDWRTSKNTDDNGRRHLVRSIDKYAGTSWYGTVITVALLLVGAWGSLYSPEIREAFPFPGRIAEGPRAGELVFRWNPKDWSGPAVIFWFSAIVVSFLTYRRQELLDRTERAERGEAKQTSELLVAKTEALGRQAVDLHERLRTLPPDDFLALFRDVAEQCHLAFTGVMSNAESVPKGEVEQAIRSVLKGIVTLVHGFDQGPSHVRYGANVMLYVPTNKIPNRTFNRYRRLNPYKSLPFYRGELDGVLCIDRKLSVVALGDEMDVTNGSAEVDPLLKGIALPVPRERQPSSRGLWKVLPGAPLAFNSPGGFSSYADTATLAEWCRTSGDFAPSVADDVEKFFSGERYDIVRSLASFAIPPGPLSEDSEPMGVLNIHRNVGGLLENRAPVEHLLPPMAPLLLMLRDLCDLYRAA